nr:hypothetical protein [Tanacetum cinerariifolium]
MAALIISISLNLSDERGGVAVVASPFEVLELDTHSSSKADPSESSLPLVSVAPMVLPFLCSDDSESDTKMPKRHILIAPILPAPSAVVAPSTDIISPVDALPGICRRRTILIRPWQDIPIGRLYLTHPGGPCKALTARKSVRPLPSHLLALRYTSHHLDRFTSGSSLGHSSSDHSLSGHSISGHFVSRHTPLVTIIADSSAPSRFVYPPFAKTLWYSKGYLRWRSAPLSTMYLLTTSESSAGDSSSESSARLSRKRCRSPAAIVTSSIHALRALVSSRTDLLPPHKRFKDSISPEDSVKEDINTDVLADIKADAMAVEVATDMDVKAGVDAGIGMEVDVGVDIEDEVEGEVESSDKGTMEVGVDVVAGIDIPNGMLMFDAVEHLEQVEEVVQDIYGHVIEMPLLRIMIITLSNMTMETIEELINQRVAEALVAYEANRAVELVVKSQSQNGDDDDNKNVGGNGNKNGEGNGDRNGGGNGNRNIGGNRNGNPSRNDRGAMPVARECTYHDVVKCQPLNFKGTEGVVALTRWFEKMETVFYISNCPERFQEITMMCTKMVPEEKDQVEKFIRGLPDNIQGNIIVAEPMRLQDDVRIAKNLMDQMLKGYAVKNTENKRRFDNNQKDNRVQQPPYKRQNVGGQSVARAYTNGNNEKKGYVGHLPY